MPNYKMVDADVLDGAMLETAKAIREKGGTEELIPWNKSTGYKEAIEAIKGGGGLNFTVVGGTEKPESPAENTVWVNTPTEIGKWTLSPMEPASPTSGDVWIVLDVGGVVIPADDEGSVYIAVSGVRQYVSGAWAIIENAQIFANGAWANVEGTEQIIYDGTWHYGYSPVANVTDATITEGYPYKTEKSGSNGIYVAPAIDMSKYSAVILDVSAYSSDWMSFSIGTVSSWGNGQYDGAPVYQNRSRTTITREAITLNVSNLSGNHYIKLCADGNNWIEVHGIRLVRI